MNKTAATSQLALALLCALVFQVRAESSTVIVQEGETVFSIGVRLFGDERAWLTLCNLNFNSFEECAQVMPGDTLLLPHEAGDVSQSATSEEELNTEVDGVGQAQAGAVDALATEVEEASTEENRLEADIETAVSITENEDGNTPESEVLVEETRTRINPTGDTLTFVFSGEAYQGNPEYRITIGGAEYVGVVDTAIDTETEGRLSFPINVDYLQTLRLQGIDLLAVDEIEVAFTNDAWGGPNNPQFDRNLALVRFAVNGEDYNLDQVSLDDASARLREGTLYFNSRSTVTFKRSGEEWAR